MRWLRAALLQKQIVSYSLLVKMVAASAVDSNGDEIYPRKWNHDFVGMPIVQKEKQPRPTFNENEVSSIIAKAPPRYAPLFALLAAPGYVSGKRLRLNRMIFHQIAKCFCTAINLAGARAGTQNRSSNSGG